MLLAVLALPAAAGGPVKLSHPTATPANGTTATTFVLTVTYRNHKGSPPDYVRVVIGDRAYRMVATGGADWKRGVEFSARMKLPPGNHDVVYLTGSPDAGDEIPGATIHVRRLPKPAGGPDGSMGGGPEPKPVPEPPVTIPKPPVTDPTPAGSPGTPPAGAPDPRATPSTPEVAVPAGPPSDSGRPGEGDTTAGIPGSWGELTRYLEVLGLDPASSPYLRLVPVMIWTTGGVAIWMAFGFFGKRRRDGEPPEPDEVLEAKAARGTGEPATAALVPESEPAPALPVDAELAMPRWRRPSLLQARKADPLRSVTEAPRLSFDHAAVAPIAGLERRLIRYLVVQLLDTPDEFRGAAVATLAQGDEVQLLERSGTYWLVLCPDGQEGWIHRMTLGDVVGAPPAPSARDTWATTSVEVEAVDDDVLTAFMTARGRA